MDNQEDIKKRVSITQPVAEIYKNLNAQANVKNALESIKKDDDWALEEIITITEIPSPPFKEKVRGEYLMKRFKELGLSQVSRDDEGNIIALRKGVNPAGPLFVVSAHIDTVFPEGTDVIVKEREGTYYAPGMGDNVRGIVTMLAIVKAMNENNIKTVGDVMFVGTVGEEGEGDLRGCKALFKENKNIAGFISIDNGDLENVVSQATGSHRYEVIFTGPGGHSYLSFGKVPSAIHAMGRAISKIADLQVPTDPITTFTVGTVSGGTTINSIASKAVLGLDLRSSDNNALLALEKEAIEMIHAAVDEENKRWNSKAKITVELKPVGNRPAGEVASDSLIVQAKAASLNAVGIELNELIASSTDSNVPMSLGIPSLTVGKGGMGGEIHSLAEWYQHKDAWLAAQSGLLLTLGLVGLRGVSEPLLKARSS